MIDYPEAGLVTLKEALDIEKHSVVPGALNVDGKRLVRYDEEENTYRYDPDIDNRQSSVIDVSEDQLEQLVPGATSRRWIPVSNFVIM